jgi:hypothetical protein
VYLADQVTVMTTVVPASTPSFCHFWKLFPPAVTGAVRVTAMLLV